MNHEDIKKILNDLYAIDPSLRSREKELTTIIRAMAIKPEAHYDPAFAARLRSQIFTELSQRGSGSARSSFASFFAGKSFRYAAIGIAVIAIAAVSFAAFGPLSPHNPGSVALNSGNVSITNVGADAFGSLSTAAGSAAPAAANAPTAAPMNTASPMMGAAISGSGTASPGVAIMPVRPLPYPAVKYDYTGSPISQSQAQLDVLKKIAAPLSADQATAALEQAGFGQVNLSTFDGLTISNVTLTQTQSFGYEISLDLADGTISISENYNEWPQESATTTPLTASDVPSNSAVIAVANQFLSVHDISTANYGTPMVTTDITNFVVPAATPAVSAGASVGSGSGSSAAAMPMIPYYPDSEQVLYPLTVNGMPVYNTNGSAIGLTVEVNIRYSRVENVYGLQAESYQSSAYDAITDTSTILSMAEDPEVYPVIYNGAMGSGSADSADTNATVTTYDLGTPTMVYEDMYQTDSNGQSSEFLVPAFAFPVVGSASDNASTRYIMVPLIKDFEQPSQSVVVPPVPRPVPLETPAAQ
ncbi:MAG TPA: hypothetical protein VMA75_04350 [Candidatus Paceibacterota bacterium]|nr:hypothetical protein [Candidatus Paceibacterota bacterium]